ncbi:esterase-like activity of phytase family protein [Deinococcus maricopensis]|uniref:Glycerophosphoryl diester phosphodiesterase n=1 Tax=Deinococcus maricopensis (strain DSM 21211 / LMG 22137 / NRRL B-23946 / LB-34) TaxID=709986 RepID=E8U5V1_DEIML|nr:esterase-like activity of phytase family protein [Deinococcus maricopensis]ADV66440.1 glycerophosphoryl diester phosphodiesterase [Deinococcus maricopensis DSM 21211]
MKTRLLSALLALTLAPAAHAAELIGYASMPADTFAEGPASGQYDGGVRAATPRFPSQPVQGFSGVQFGPNGTFLFLPDNGFGAKANSADYLLRVYRMNATANTAAGGAGTLTPASFISLRDPDRKVPFVLVNESTPERLLTGADFDVESLVAAPDGTLWIGDEFGPYLLHFDATGKLLEAPYATPNFETFATLSGKAPIVIGHRGSSGTRPEHTLAAYQAAIDAGADFVEPDLVVTRDGVLIARHEPILASVDANGKVTEATTDVADHPEFKDRLTTKTLDGVTVRGYFAEDFTLAELRTLRAKERLPQLRGTAFDGQFTVPTLEDIITLVKDVEARTGRKIGIYPETKHPTYFLTEGKHADGTPINVNLGQKIVDTLVKTGFTDPNRVFIQSFETANLRELATKILPAAGLKVPLVQLINGGGAPYDFTASGDKRTYADLVTPDGLKGIAAYAQGAGPNKALLFTADKNTLKPTAFVRDAHAAGLQVHPWTVRAEPAYLPAAYAGDVEAEFRDLIRAGVDGYFTDFPAIGTRVRAQYTTPEVRSPQNPALLAAGTSPGAPSAANLNRSKGYEGLALSADKTRLIALLEGTVAGDPDGTLRLNTFDLKTRTFTGLAGRYRLENPAHAIGDLTAVNDHEYLVIERDEASGSDAKFKKIYKIDLNQRDAGGNVQKTELVDLLNLRDPRGLAPSTQAGVFSFPFVTIEDVLVLDQNTILVANDNNYPGTGGRGKDVKDDTEVLWIKLDAPLTVAPGVGR